MCVQIDTLEDAAVQVSAARYKVRAAMDLVSSAGVTVDEYLALLAESRRIEVILAKLMAKIQDAKGC